MSLELYVETYRDQRSRYILKGLKYRDKAGYLIPGNTMDTTHFVFDTNAMIIQHVRVADMHVGVSYAMSLYKARPQNSNQ